VGPDSPAARRLAAILFTDIVGYTALIARSEAQNLFLRKGLSLQERVRTIRLHGGTPTW
jgi:class 3 adenylate cyclase